MDVYSTDLETEIRKLDTERTKTFKRRQRDAIEGAL